MTFSICRYICIIIITIIKILKTEAVALLNPEAAAPCYAFVLRILRPKPRTSKPKHSSFSVPARKRTIA